MGPADQHQAVVLLAASCRPTHTLPGPRVYHEVRLREISPEKSPKGEDGEKEGKEKNVIQKFKSLNLFAITQVAFTPWSESRQPLSGGESPQSLMATLRSWQQNDRGVMDLANRAYVSAVQAYAKHECNLVLRMKGTQGEKNYLLPQPSC